MGAILSERVGQSLVTRQEQLVALLGMAKISRPKAGRMVQLAG